MTESVRIRVICDAESHAPKVATVDRWKLRDHGSQQQVLAQSRDSEHLINEQRRPRSERYDAPIGPIGPDGIPMMPPNMTYRERWPMTCPLCGLRVELRQETALKLALALAASGVSQVRLSALAASL